MSIGFEPPQDEIDPPVRTASLKRRQKQVNSLNSITSDTTSNSVPEMENAPPALPPRCSLKKDPPPIPKRPQKLSNS